MESLRFESILSDSDDSDCDSVESLCQTPCEKGYFSWRSFHSPRISRDDSYHSKSQSYSDVSQFKHMLRRNSRSFENLRENLSEIFLKQPVVKTQSLQSLSPKPKSPKKANFEKNIFLSKLMKGRPFASSGDLSLGRKFNSSPVSPNPSDLEHGPALLPTLLNVVRLVFFLFSLLFVCK